MSYQKSQLRAQLLAGRKNLTPQARAEANAALVAQVCALARDKKVAAYSPLATEPGGPSFADTLYQVTRQLWLPVSGAHGQLSWATYQGEGSLRPGALGILEPTGPRRDNAVLNELDLIFTPALGVTPEGYRLGKGGGYYDRALATTATCTAVLLFDSEINADIPVEPHDRPVDIVITPSAVHYLRQ
ncbi:hypothetical protein CPHO_08770 [Corynebacterium phocae]|uniref:5-formyltetrahydrofolate cyclo-ligase n=1 Tax=Corynebacterium phocae TaxID=161895 RepID=A0A1L7D6I0_9CORY|nr:5-formyltetrahydrofolate cyclo-ligase [Corynebacterium phocae]APT93759.1 hypothetical protein CPHO_08770 [Corynebacterium phocae]